MQQKKRLAEARRFSIDYYDQEDEQPKSFRKLNTELVLLNVSWRTRNCRAKRNHR